MDTRPKLSVLMITYNHERFIAQAIESALMQQTTFAYEIVVGEDCSTDDTREIITDLQAAHPDKIRLLPTDEGRLGMHRNFVRTYEACRGEYVALLDGDDYWTSVEKLQRQVEFLDAHPECSMCFHNALIVYDDDTQELLYCPSNQKEFSELEDILEENFVPTCSVVSRNKVIKEFPDWMFKLIGADWAFMVLLAEQGKIGYLKDTMAVLNKHGGGAWTSAGSDARINDIAAMYTHLNEYFGFKYDDLIRTLTARWKANEERDEARRYCRVLTFQIRDVVPSILPPDTTVLVVNKGDEELLDLHGWRAWHFPQTEEGIYAGSYPADSRAAIAHLERLRAKGADYLLFPSAAFWWLEHYGEFHQHLESRYGRVWSDERCIIYQLSQPKAGEATEDWQQQIQQLERDQLQGLHLSSMMAIDEKSFYIRGWMRDETAKIRSVTAVSPEGIRTELLERVFRYPRPDANDSYDARSTGDHVTKPGFGIYFEVNMPSHLSTGWTLELRNAAGENVRARAPAVVRDPITVRNTILRDVAYERVPNENLKLLDYIFPAISRLQERLRERVEVESVNQYGTPNESPDVTIIVPLYRRIDFLEHQLSEFVHDPEIHQAELIYVLDSPELTNRLREFAAQLFQLYRVPFRIVTFKQSVGIAAVNHVAATLARGRLLLLLLSSDILPDKPGWLKTMSAFYDATPQVGALGPKLLYEDDTLQHAGNYFAHLSGSHLWESMTYFKRFQRHLPAANVPRPVPTVSGACLMMDRDLYKLLGGLRGIYVEGYYEDSDLCLRLIEAGYRNWYLPDAELYHFEGRSRPGTARRVGAQYNVWLHTQLWNERIEAVMASAKSWQPSSLVV